MMFGGVEWIDVVCVDGCVVVLGVLYGVWSVDVLFDVCGLYVLLGVVDS